MSSDTSLHCENPNCYKPCDGTLAVVNARDAAKRKLVCSDDCASWLIGYARILGHTYVLVVVEAAAPPCVNYLSAGDNPYASGDRAYTGCSLCGQPRSAHAK